jgi:hypothetical protein
MKRLFCSLSLTLITWTLGAGLAHAQDLPPPTSIWTGGYFGSDGVNNGANWLSGTTPLTDGDAVLYFGEAEQYTVYNDIAAPWRVRNIIFGADATESYTISGDSLRMDGLSGNNATKNIIRNESSLQHEIENNFYFTLGMTFDTKVGDLIWSGSAEANPGTGTFTLVKLGAGSLVVRGSTVMQEPDPDNPVGVKQFNWQVLNGTLVMDASSPSFASNANITLSNATSSSGNLKVIGSEEGETNLQLGTLTYLSANRVHRITVDSNGGEGTTVNFANWTYGHSATPGLAYAVRFAGTLYVDISSGNSAVTFSTFQASPVVNGIIPIAIVTDSGGTGLGALGPDNSIVRYTGYSAMPVSGSSGSAHYQVTGDLVLTGSANTYSLTIKQAGELSSASASGHLNVMALLMEPGVGDYTISTPYFGAQSTNLRIYQLSTDGVLTIAGNFGSSGGSYQGSTFGLIGPGTVRLTGEGTVGDPNNPDLPKGFSIAGGYYIASGRLEINSTGANTAMAVEVNDGTLAGNGQIGGGIRWGWNGSVVNLGTNYPLVSILNGGTLDASNNADKALSIHGRVSLAAGATYHMVLGANPGDPLTVTKDPDSASTTVALNGDLSLDLQYMPSMNERIILLITNGTISGQFLTVNGEGFGGEDNNEFFLLYKNNFEYMFSIDYAYDLGDGNTAVAIQVLMIPEPQTVAMLSGLALLGVVMYFRRRKS